MHPHLPLLLRHTRISWPLLLRHTHVSWPLPSDTPTFPSPSSPRTHPYLPLLLRHTHISWPLLSSDTPTYPSPSSPQTHPHLSAPPLLRHTHVSWPLPSDTPISPPSSDTHLLPYFCHVPSGQDLQVGLQSTAVECLSVQHTVHGSPEENVPLQRVVLDPGLLGNVGHPALRGKWKRRGGGRNGSRERRQYGRQLTLKKKNSFMAGMQVG